LTLGKVQDANHPDFNRFNLLENLLPVYIQVLQRLQALGAEWVQIDEPVFALDLSTEQLAALATTYATLAAAAPGLKIMVATYFGSLCDNLHHFIRLPVAALHIDLVRAPQDLDAVIRELETKKLLSIGVVAHRLQSGATTA
jgi:5-methyltetrahydropteroyltriglutamate--homocysteine methyltransferase